MACRSHLISFSFVSLSLFCISHPLLVRSNVSDWLSFFLGGRSNLEVVRKRDSGVGTVVEELVIVQESECEDHFWGLVIGWAQI